MRALRSVLGRMIRRRPGPQQLRDFLERALADFPWQVSITDWQGTSYRLGGDEPHWFDQPLEVTIKTGEAARDLLRLDGLAFLDRYLEGEVELEGNLFLLPELRHHTRLGFQLWRALPTLVKNLAFQNTRSARVNVKSHYDIPQEALNVYLDKKYMSYSCGMWERPEDFSSDDLLTPGEGEKDDFDSLEKSMWRKFKDAVDFVAPEPGEDLLDVGCGYGGQLAVALENHPFGRVVGWTHSHNQATTGRRLLEHLDPGKWELREGDYREDDRVFDHITSTGMISHVGPRGLIPYVRNVRRRIKRGGRYLHHSLMTAYNRLPLNWNVGILFNKKYVWPGFHWFSLGEHVRALEKSGFQVVGTRSLTKHYAKTTAAWYSRMMAHREVMGERLGEATLRAWRIFLAGICGSFLTRQTHVYRLYCESV